MILDTDQILVNRTLLVKSLMALEVTHYSICFQVYFVNRLSGRTISGDIKVCLVLSQDDSGY